MIELIILGVILALLFVGGILADYVLPHVGPLVRYLDSLPMSREEEPEPGPAAVSRMDAEKPRRAA